MNATCFRHSSGPSTLRRSTASYRKTCQQFRVCANPTALEVCTDIPTRMNTIPHSREMRQWFYKDAATAVIRCITDSKQARLKIRLTVPELNPEMDVYRVGTLLELAREMALQIADDGRRVKVCVQGSMGAGVFQALPLSLNGVSKIMRAMDWGDVEEFVTLGEISGAEVDDSQVYLLLCPQNIVGGNIVKDLLEMVERAEAEGKFVVLINPVLKDVPSANGVMGVRGRAERLKFNDTFVSAYHFRLIYFAGTMYPIMGALRQVVGGKWQVYKRCDVTNTTEEFRLWGEFDSEPNGGQITACLQKFKTPLQLRGLEPEEPKKTNWW